jgi:hypothetical protein
VNGRSRSQVFATRAQFKMIRGGEPIYQVDITVSSHFARQKGEFSGLKFSRTVGRPVTGAFGLRVGNTEEFTANHQTFSASNRRRQKHL